MPQVSLLGNSLAQPGTRFVFLRPCEVADRCPVARTCQNLELGRTYRVVARRNAHHDVCTEHEGGVHATDVEALPIVTSIEAAKLRGTLVKWAPLVCTKRGCPNWNTCFDTAPKTGVTYEVRKNLETLVCPMGYELRRVELAPHD